MKQKQMNYQILTHMIYWGETDWGGVGGNRAREYRD